MSDIKTGIIHSNDYEVRKIPFLYPASDVYPAESTYPSNGETVIKGFAIDFSAGVIYGAFYSDQIAALQEAVHTWDADVEQINADLQAQAEAILGLHDSDELQGQAIAMLQHAIQTQEQTLAQIGQEMADIKQGTLGRCPMPRLRQRSIAGCSMPALKAWTS